MNDKLIDEIAEKYRAKWSLSDGSYIVIDVLRDALREYAAATNAAGAEGTLGSAKQAGSTPAPAPAAPHAERRQGERRRDLSPMMQHHHWYHYTGNAPFIERTADRRQAHSTFQNSEQEITGDDVELPPLDSRALLYTDTILGQQVMRDDMWAITTAERDAWIARIEALVRERDEYMRIAAYIEGCHKKAESRAEFAEANEDKLTRRLRYYEDALCYPTSRPYAVSADDSVKTIEPVRISTLLQRLESAEARLREGK